MLIQFSVKNYRSIKEELTIQLSKGKGDELATENTFAVDAKGATNLELLKSAVIYGANAAGKSNIINALAEMRWMVVNSANKLQANDLLPIDPFAFSTETLNQPTEFIIDFISEGIRYQYGYTATKKRIIEEWLFAYPNGKAQTWFYREYDPLSGLYEWTKDSYLAGTKANWKNATRENALFLSTAVQFNSKQLKPVFSWFNDKLGNVGVDGVSPEYTATKILAAQKNENNQQIKKTILDFLNSADIDICDIKVKEEDLVLPDNLPIELKNSMLETLKDKKILEISTGHRMEDSDQICYLNLHEESEGTKRIFSLITPWIESLEEGNILFIDEIHNNLHPNMVKFLIDLFHNQKSNPYNAQLVFTTHETSILNKNTFRRDQIWFCEKNAKQQTMISSLSEYKVRKGSVNIERDYLAGLYGAVPFIENKAFNVKKEDDCTTNKSEMERQNKELSDFDLGDK